MNNQVYKLASAFEPKRKCCLTSLGQDLYERRKKSFMVKEMEKLWRSGIDPFCLGRLASCAVHTKTETIFQPAYMTCSVLYVRDLYYRAGSLYMLRLLLFSQVYISNFPDGLVLPTNLILFHDIHLCNPRRNHFKAEK